MKKILLFSACIMLAFSSCKKSDKNSIASNTIMASVDGSSVSFNSEVKGSLSPGVQGTYVLVVVGATGTGNNEQSIHININSGKPIARGTYSYSSSTSPNATTLPQLSYGISAARPVSFMSDGQHLTTVTITSISNTNIQGTFSGVLLSTDDATTTKSITNGKFNVALVTYN